MQMALRIVAGSRHRSDIIDHGQNDFGRVAAIGPVLRQFSVLLARSGEGVIASDLPVWRGGNQVAPMQRCQR
jgi:hypothetical protein